MIYEYAIEPQYIVECSDRWQIKLIKDAIGLGQARVPTHYPNKGEWRSIALKHLIKKKLKGTDKSRAEAMITWMVNNKGTARTTKQSLNSWLHAAIIEHGLNPFHALLVRDNQIDSTSPPEMISDGHIVNSSPLWDKDTSITVERTALAMAQAVKPVLSIAKWIAFIDPFYASSDVRLHADVLKSFLKIISMRSILPERIQIHAKFDPGSRSGNSITNDQFKTELIRNIKPIVPSGLKLEVKRWEQMDRGKEIHGRFILTDVGLLRFDPGLDSMAPGKVGEQCGISIMSKAEHQERWNDYIEERAFIDALHGEEFIITGS